MSRECGEQVVGISLEPLANANCYEPISSLCFAAEKEQLLMLQEILSKGVVDVNSFSVDGFTALMLAAMEGSLSSMKYLLISKAKLGRVGFATDQRTV